MDAPERRIRRVVTIRAGAAMVSLAAAWFSLDAAAATKCICTDRHRTVWDLSDRGCDAVCDGPGIPADQIERRDGDGASGAERCFYRNRWISCREASRLERQQLPDPPTREVVCDRGHVAHPANPTASEIARCRATRPKTRYQPR